MAKITRKFYALATELNLLERGNPEDPFHQIVFRVTGKEHVSELTEKEEKAVLKELLAYKETDKNPQKISESQQDKVWKLIYRLCELDPSDAKPFDRLSGALKKILNTSCARSDPFKWVRKKDASKLINTLDGYVKTAERKMKNEHK